MALRAGTNAVREAKQAADARGNFSGLRRIFFRPGEVVTARFIGDFEGEAAPIVAQMHYVKGASKGQQYQNCGQNNDTDCVLCYYKAGDSAKGIAQHKGISATSRANFFLWDARKQHRLENPVRVLKPGIRVSPGKPAPADAYFETKYPPCSAPLRPCQFCKSGNVAQASGFCMWTDVATSYADQVLSQIADLRDYCRCGARADGAGTIVVTEYLCGKCQQPVEFYPDQGSPVAKCGFCKNTLEPLEVIECTACEAPERATLQDFFFKITRVGSGQDTSYNFEAVHPVRPMTEEEEAEAEKVAPDWGDVLAPQPPEAQAALLGLPNPFSGHGVHAGHGSIAFDDTESADVEWGTPAPKTAVLPKKKVFKVPGRRV